VREREAVWRRAAETWSRAGLHAEAGVLFERALRYAPDAPDALAGLGRALVAEGRAPRGAALLARALERAEARGDRSDAIALSLAKALAEALRDLPAAIARARSIANDASEALEARALEGRWRAALGDLGGASLAYAKLRDLAATRAEGDREGVAATAFAALVEAARFERVEREDLFAAQRHLACALRLRPNDAGALAAYREVGSAIAGRGAGASEGVGENASESAGAGAGAGESELPEDAEARVHELTQKLQGDPTRDDVADELARLLRGLGRSHELLALLSARLEDATPERRVKLVPATKAVLADLEREAREAGRDAEAALFRDFLGVLE
jgi:thioredoxin-like negative regulator of GroEL